MAKCFVIMPLTTPASALDHYGGDAEHFIHVLDHLFSPAVEAAGYELVRPVMRGADLIHAEIVKNLEEAELVLCDFSLLNANVFFELGIRTALDRPVALVKDDKTSSPPFDTAGINYHTYDSSLAPWTLDAEVTSVTKHLEETAAGADGRNSLWRVFGLTQRGAPAEVTDPVNAKLDLLVTEVEKLRERNTEPRRDWGQSRTPSDPPTVPPELLPLLGKAATIAAETAAKLHLLDLTSERVKLEGRPRLDDVQKARIRELFQDTGRVVSFSDPW